MTVTEKSQNEKYTEKNSTKTIPKNDDTKYFRKDVIHFEKRNLADTLSLER